LDVDGASERLKRAAKCVKLQELEGGVEPRDPPGEKHVYVSEILEQCSEMAARTAQVYRRLAERLQGEPERVRLWRELALEEETHADVLRRELKSFQEQDHVGAFLPEYVERLSHLDAQLCRLERRADTARTLDEALAVAVALEQADLEDLYDDLVLQGEPAFRLMSERIEAALAVKPQQVAAAGLAKPRRR
jgi:hypothetical protein